MTTVPNANQGCPCFLTPEEMNEPREVIARFFEYAHLSDLRAQLWNWLSATVSGDFISDLKSHERSEIMYLYNQLQKLIEANFILNRTTA